ncbi:hypothetical protein ACHAW6_002345 [Cyclotella cf. meneghiniana]
MPISNCCSKEFIATVLLVRTLSSEATSFLEVIAPATLPEGYTFEAKVNGKMIMVTVSMGGVQAGQNFSIPFDSQSNAYVGALVSPSSVLMGHWKDGLCACCRLGCCHPVLWLACCCPLSEFLDYPLVAWPSRTILTNTPFFAKVLLGQVMHHLKLTWLVNEGGLPAETVSTFCIMFWMGIVVWILTYSLPHAPYLFMDENGEISGDYLMAQYIVNIVLLAFAVFRIGMVCKMCELIRNKYQIPSKCCGGCEDCCCAFWCSCCTVAQMARHTSDYATYQGM